jgi:hypothetical protein
MRIKLLGSILGPIGLIAVGAATAFTNKLGENAAEHVLSTAKAPDASQPPANRPEPLPPTTTASSPNAFIALSSHSGLSNLGIITGGSKIGILNQNTEDASVDHVRISGNPDIAIANINSKNPTVTETTIEMNE